MFFHNLVIFTFPVNFPGLIPSPVAEELDDLSARMDEARLKPVGALELASVGFISPYGRDEQQLVHDLEDKRWISCGSEERILPAAVVNELLRKKVLEIEEREGYAPGAKARKRLKDDLIHELLPQAFVKPGRTDAYLDLGRGLICVDTSSRRRGEQVVSEMRRALGSFPALPLNAEVSPRAVLTGWLAGEALPEGFSLGEECELRDAMEGGAVVKVQNTDLHGEEVQKHLETGLQCTRLAVVYQDHVSLVLDEDLTIRKLRFLDGAVDQLENTNSEDLRAELDARFALMTGELAQVLDALFDAFKVTRPDAEPKPPASNAKRSKKDDPQVSISAVGPDGKEQHLVTMASSELREAAEEMKLCTEATAHVRKLGRVSVSNLQRVFKLGYNRAARIVELLEHQRIVSPPDSSGHRKVL